MSIVNDLPIFIFSALSASPLCTYTPTPQQDSVPGPSTTFKIAPQAVDETCMICKHDCRSYTFRQQLEYVYPYLESMAQNTLPSAPFNPNKRKRSGMTRPRRQQRRSVQPSYLPFPIPGVGPIDSPDLESTRHPALQPTYQVMDRLILPNLCSARVWSLSRTHDSALPPGYLPTSSL